VRRDELVTHHQVAFYGKPPDRRGRFARFLAWWTRNSTAALPAPRAIAKGPPRGVGGASAGHARRESGSVAA
jgi:hypothetical protein